MRATLVVAIILVGGTASAADYPKSIEADVVLKDFQFTTGEALDLKVHYRTLGEPRRDQTGTVRNAILILLINPPELGILEREIQRVPKGQAIVIPASTETVGHGTHTKAAVWKKYLEKLLKEIEG
jgi:hypothetical protein